MLSNEISESGATPMWWRMLTQCPDISPSQDDVHPPRQRGFRLGFVRNRSAILPPRLKDRPH